MREHPDIVVMNDSRVTEYLSRELRDLHAHKSMADDVVDKFVDDASAVFQTEPFKHQSRCMLAMLNVPKILLLLSPGSGKTKIVLDTLAYRIANGDVTKRALVVVPSPSNIAAWQAEIETHQKSLTCGILPLTHNIPAGRVILTTYSRLTRLLCVIPPRGKGKRKAKWRVDVNRIEAFAAHFDFVVFDESTFIKNQQSLVTRIAAGLSWRAPYSAGLTGTPFGLDPCDLFGQFLVVDGGAAFGKSITMFRAAFTREQDNYFKGKIYRMDPAREDDMRRAMRHSSIHYSLDECVSLPPITNITREVRISDAAREDYNDLRDECRAAMSEDDEGDPKDVAGAFIRMCQIATGFRVDTDEETGEREEIDYDENPKMDALHGLVDEIPVDSKLVIFHWFIRSGNRIAKMLDGMGIQYRRLYSGTDDAAAAYDDFRNDPDVRVFVVNPKSGGYGLNLQVANYAIFYESPVSPIEREQAVDRVYRTGQDKPVFIYDIVARRTVEYHILQLVREGKNALTAVLNGAKGIV